MTFEDVFVTLRDDQFGKLRRQKPFQPPDAPQFLDLLGDPRLETAVEFRYFLRALPKFVKQPSVLDRDHRLRGEVLQKCDLLFGEQPHLLSVTGNKADTIVSLSEWHEKDGVQTT